jgi:hypothetical protein
MCILGLSATFVVQASRLLFLPLHLGQARRLHHKCPQIRRRAYIGRTALRGPTACGRALRRVHYLMFGLFDIRVCFVFRASDFEFPLHPEGLAMCILAKRPLVDQLRRVHTRYPLGG